MQTQITNQIIFTPAFQKEAIVKAKSIAVKAEDYKLSLVFSEQRKIGEDTSWQTLATCSISSLKLYEIGVSFFEAIHASVRRNLFASNVKDMPSDGVLLRASYTLSDMHVLRVTAGFKSNGERKDRFLKMELFKAPSWQWITEKRNLDKNKTDWGSENRIFSWDLAGQYPANGLFSTTTDLLFIKSLSEAFQDIHLCRNTTWQMHKNAVFESNKDKNKTSSPDTEQHLADSEIKSTTTTKDISEIEIEDDFVF